MKHVTIDLHRPCPVCEKQISVVTPFAPHGDVIAHHACHLEAFREFCCERELPINDDSYDEFVSFLDGEDE